MPKIVQPARIPELLRPGMTVFVQGASGEPTGLLDAIASTPEASRGVHYVGCFLPAVNLMDPASFHPEASLTSFFLFGDIAHSHDAGKVRFVPLHYSGIFAYVAALPIDLALIQVTPPDATGQCSLGPSVHFVPAVLDHARTIVAEINAAMPRPANSVCVPYERIDAAIETHRPLVRLETGQLSAQTKSIGTRIAELIQDSDTVQVGIGKIPASVLAALHSHKDLRLHGGMITDEVIDLQASGALRSGPDTMVCATSLGHRIYDWTADRTDLRFAPVSHTHDVCTIGGIDKFVAINGVLAVDLSGQANAETVRGRQVSGTGGLLDYVRGARLSQGGRSILALPSTAGGTSRIVPRLDANDMVSLPRADADIVVTEHGVAHLRDKSLAERADALIAISDPSVRDALANAWRSGTEASTSVQGA
ncbi:MAG: acetyl-CoA hydrolase/transferase C-terminal domain-containing protein [Pseudomonadota bacterium]